MHRVKILSYSLVLGLAACGGGGSDGVGGIGGGGSGSRSPVPPQTALTYSGNVNGAALTTSTTGAVAANVIGSTGAGIGSSMLTGVSVQVSGPVVEQQSGASGLAQILMAGMRTNDIGAVSSGSGVTAANIAATIPCDSGSISVSGTTNDTTNAGSGTVDFIDCRTGSNTLNGPAALTVTTYDPVRRIVRAGTLNFTRARLTGPGFSWDISGPVDVTVNVVSSSRTDETIRLRDVVVQDNNNPSHMMRAVNLAVTNRYDAVNPTSSFFRQSISGTVFDSTHGSVTVSTEAAPHTAPWGDLYYSTRTQSFPDWGIINLAGATGSARITVLGTDMARIDITDGATTTTARTKWTDLGTSWTADLRDTDGDGMHNSWETARGLNPNGDDAAGDRDGDGYTNLEEYYAGSDAGTSGSIPSASRHIWVTNVVDLADAGGGMLNIFTDSSGNGVQLNTLTGDLGADFSGVANPPARADQLSTTDGMGRTFTLTPTPGNSRVYTLTNNTTGASITINNVAGTNASRLTRYGTRGIAFRTVGVSTPGYVYFIESRTLIP